MQPMSPDRVDVYVGESFELSFEARPTAGYRWRPVWSSAAKAHLQLV